MENQVPEELKTLYFPMPFGLVSQWVDIQRWARDDRSIESGLVEALTDWQGQWAMLDWITTRVARDHAVAARVPRNYIQDVDLEYHLAVWFIVLRICYDSIGNVVRQMAPAEERGKLPTTSFKGWLRYEPQAKSSSLTRGLDSILKRAEVNFLEARRIRTDLTHFIPAQGAAVSPPKRIYVYPDNSEGVKVGLAGSRFQSLLGEGQKWPVKEIVRKHFRALHELTSQLQDQFLSERAEESFPGYYAFVYEDVFEFLDVASFSYCGYERWERGWSASILAEPSALSD